MAALFADLSNLRAREEGRKQGEKRTRTFETVEQDVQKLTQLKKRSKKQKASATEKKRRRRNGKACTHSEIATRTFFLLVFAYVARRSAACHLHSSYTHTHTNANNWLVVFGISVHLLG